MPFKRSQTSIGIRRPFDGSSSVNNFPKLPENFKRSATAFDLRRHYAAKSLYTNTSTLYVKRKFNFRPTNRSLAVIKSKAQLKQPETAPFQREDSFFQGNLQT